MTRRALTDRLVQSLTAEGKSQFEHYDGFCPGLLLRVSSGGSKVWDLAFKSPTDGKRARLRIGRYPVIGLAKAREEAVSALAKVAEGRDPRIVLVEVSPKTIAELYEDRLALHLRAERPQYQRHRGQGEQVHYSRIGSVLVRDFRIDPARLGGEDPVDSFERLLVLAGMQHLGGFLQVVGQNRGRCSEERGRREGLQYPSTCDPCGPG